MSVRVLDLAVILVGLVIWGRRRLECVVSKIMRHHDYYHSLVSQHWNHQVRQFFLFSKESVSMRFDRLYLLKSEISMDWCLYIQPTINVSLFWMVSIL